MLSSGTRYRVVDVRERHGGRSVIAARRSGTSGGPGDADPRIGRGKLLGSIALSAAAAGAFGRIGSGSAAAAAARPSAAQDRAILNFALLLEYLSSAFYDEALGSGVLRGEAREFAETAGSHERDHSTFLKRALGSHARPKPAVQFGTATQNAQK